MTLTSADIGFNFGLEQEHFVCSNYAEGYGYEEATFELPSEKVARDNAGYLAESRGDHSKDPYKAVFSLKAENTKAIHTLAESNLLFWPGAKAKLPERLKLEAYRKYGLPRKDKLIANLYDEALTDEQLEWQYAGIHINISKIKHVVKFGHSSYVTEAFDHVPVIKWLDKFFEKDIKESGRLRGSYSIKELDGGFGLEYRSLPSNMHLTYSPEPYKFERSVLEGLVLLKKEVLNY